MKIIIGTKNGILWSSWLNTEEENVLLSDPEYTGKYQDNLVDAARLNKSLIAFVEKEMKELVDEDGDYTGNLIVVTIPDNSTDWDILYDSEFGSETIVYVVDGKIHYVDEEGHRGRNLDEWP